MSSSPPPPDPLDHDDYRTWFQAWIDQAPGRSQTLLARRVGASRSMVAMILQGRRRLPLALAMPWARELGVEGDALLQFEALVRQEEGESLSARRLARQHLRALRAHRDAELLGDKQFGLLERWYVPVILELARTGALQDDATWLSERLWPEVDAPELRTALDDLFEAGALVRPPDGIQARHEAMATVREPQGDASAIAKRYHAEQLAHASDALHEFGPDERYLASLTVAIPRARLPELVEALHRVPLEVTAPFREIEGADHVVQLSVQLFPRVRGSEADDR